MKVKSQAPASPAASKKPKAPAAKPPDAPKVNRGWTASARRTQAPVAAARQAVTAAATRAVSVAITAQDSQHPLLEKFGEGLGKALGVLVTEALAAVPSWNTPVLDASGKPTQHVEGADRIGNHDILKRHQEVVGPQIAALVEKMPPGAQHDLVDGLARGATEAPGDSYRLEARVADLLKKG